MKKIFDAGQYGIREFEFWGNYADATDASVPTPIFAVPEPPIIESCTFTLQTFSAEFSKFEVDDAAKILPRVDGRALSSILGYVYTAREPKGACQIAAETVATFNAENKVRTGAVGATQIIVGSTTGNIINCQYPKNQLLSKKDAPREEFLDWAFELGFFRNSGDDWETETIT